MPRAARPATEVVAAARELGVHPGYALGREVSLSDEPLLKAMQARLAKENYRFSVAVEMIVTSEQFRSIRSVRNAKAKK